MLGCCSLESHTGWDHGSMALIRCQQQVTADCQFWQYLKVVTEGFNLVRTIIWQTNLLLLHASR